MSKGIDREALHRYIWDHANRAGQIRMNQTALAAQLGVNKFTMSRIVGELTAAGRLKKLTIHHGNFRTYAVADPDEFDTKEAKSG